MIFPAAELKPPVALPLKRDYVMRDFERSARFAGVPYRTPPRFPLPTQNAARVFWWLDEADPSRASAWARTALRAMFTRELDLSDAAVLRQLAAECDIDPARAEAAWTDPRWKQRLKDENDAAIAQGIFGAPFFVVDGEPFWGNDRRSQLERWLESGPF